MADCSLWSRLQGCSLPRVHINYIILQQPQNPFNYLEIELNKSNFVKSESLCQDNQIYKLCIFHSQVNQLKGKIKDIINKIINLCNALDVYEDKDEFLNSMIIDLSNELKLYYIIEKEYYTENPSMFYIL